MRGGELAGIYTVYRNRVHARNADIIGARINHEDSSTRSSPPADNRFPAPRLGSGLRGSHGMAILLGRDDDLSRVMAVLGRTEALSQRLSNADREAPKGPVKQKFHRDGVPGSRGLRCTRLRRRLGDASLPQRHIPRGKSVVDLHGEAVTSRRCPASRKIREDHERLRLGLALSVAPLPRPAFPWMLR